MAKTKATFVHKFRKSAYIETRVSTIGVKDAKITYTVHPDGKIDVTYKCKATLDMLRFGLKFTMPKKFDAVTWYGRGPHETYCDRKTGGKLAVHSMSVNDLEHHYMRPQENGQRTDVRTLEVLDKDGKGLKLTATGDKPFCFTCHHYTVDELDRAEHIHELHERDITEVCVDLMQRGVGGDTPGNACLRDPYIMHKGTEYAFSFTVETK